LDANFVLFSVYKELACRRSMIKYFEKQRVILPGNYFCQLPKCVLWCRDKDKHAVFVTNLPKDFDANNLISHFAKWGLVSTFVVARENNFAIIEYYVP